MLTLLIFIIVIGVLIFVHELGHFVVAKLCGIQVDEFALGFGPKIFSFKKGETDYRLNLLPFGGYVKMAGEADYEDKNPRGFEAQNGVKKLLVILAGVFMNFLLACLIYSYFMFSFGFAQYIPNIIPNQFPFGQVSNKVEFQADPSDKTSPISKFNLKSVYILSSINGQSLTDPEQVSSAISSNKGKEISISFTDTQGQNERTISLIPRSTVEKGKGLVGVVLSPVIKISFNGWQKPISGVLYSMDMLQYNVSAFSTLIGDAIKTKTASVVTSNITGPVGIYEVTGAVYQEFGFIGLLNLIALLSLALALMNVLPLPVLDGGYALIIIIEGIIRRSISPKIKGWINNIGIGFLILLMVFVTLNDINNFNIVTQIVHIFKR